MQLRQISIIFAIWMVLPALAQDAPPLANPQEVPSTENNLEPSPPVENSNTPPPQDKRVFGVIPNNRTTEGSYPYAPITAKRKMTIAFKDSFDWPVYLTSGLFATLYQLDDQNHSFGQGMQGYGKRYGTAYGDQMIGNMMTEGIMPSLFHEDPRYFRVGEGSKKSRIGKALLQIMVTRTDSGGRMFNFSEWGGNAAAAAISNAYYPDSRTASENLEKLLVACGTDAFSNLLKEFWPDVKRHFQRKREERDAADR